MKKLMTVMAAAATALFAIGAVNGDPLDSPLGTSFEGYGTNPFSPWADDTGSTANNGYWYMDKSVGADTGTVLTNEVAAATVSRPDMYTDVANNTALSLDTSSPLFRTVDTNDGNGLPATSAAIGDGIYLDTLVKFTAADDVFGDDALAAGDKIAISYVEQGDDVENPITNFVIRAGYIGGEGITATNYIATLPAGVEFNKDAWHRLTVRTLPGIDTVGNLGFVVYVDTNALVYADANQTIGDNVTLAGAALSLDKSVFPSAVAFNNGTDGSTITAASFSGTGAIDDVVFTKVMPGFIATSSAVPVSITLGTGVTGVTVTVGQDTINPVDATATPLVFNLPAGTTSFSLAGTLDAGYQNFTAVFAEETSTFVNGTVSFTGVSLAFTVKASRNNFNVFDENGDAISGTYETLSQALTATGVAKIQLAYDYDVAANEAANFAGYTIAGDIVLDLAGKTINGGSSNTRCLFATGNLGKLIVINSVDSDNGKIIYGGTAGVFDCNAGEITIGSNKVTDYGPVIDGPAIGGRGYIYSIYTGKFLASVNTTTSGDEFVCNTEDVDAGIDVVDSDSTVKLVSGYWVVTPNGGGQSEYPSYIDKNVAYKGAYDTWKTNNKVAAGDNKYEAAFLLNIAPDAEDQTLEPASITIADGKVVITANKNLGTVNGKVYVKTATTLAGLKTAEWAEASLDENTKAINVTPDSTDTAGFYQIKVDF